MASEEATRVRPQRADARRNRQRIVRAARAVFAEHGREAQIDDVARRAKVGVGTVYRHFPTKESLLEAVAADKFERVVELAHAAAEVPDPWEALEGFMKAAAENLAGDRNLYDVMATQGGPEACAPDCLVELRVVLGDIMARAQAAGQLRPGIVPDDMGLIMCACGGAMFGGAQGDWRRVLALVLDGLRAPGAGPLSS